jgi:biopolymer transport protein ExbD
MASSKLRDSKRLEEKEVTMDMSPMIDMVFLLLIFFIVVSTPMTVRVDPEVKPAVAFNSIKPEDKNGRIVLNVRGEKDYRKSIYKEEEGGKMQTEEEIVEYIKSEVKRFNKMNPEYKVKLHLRGSKDTLFEHSQIAVSAAAKAGVADVIFSVYPFSSK